MVARLYVRHTHTAVYDGEWASWRGDWLQCCSTKNDDLKVDNGQLLVGDWSTSSVHWQLDGRWLSPAELSTVIHCLLISVCDSVCIKSPWAIRMTRLYDSHVRPRSIIVSCLALYARRWYRPSANWCQLRYFLCHGFYRCQTNCTSMKHHAVQPWKGYYYLWVCGGSIQHNDVLATAA